MRNPANSEDERALPAHPFKRVDWNKLRMQKAWLNHRYKLATTSTQVKSRRHMLGLLNLVDSIQEYGVEVMGLDPELVWGPDAVDKAA